MMSPETSPMLLRLRAGRPGPGRAGTGSRIEPFSCGADTRVADRCRTGGDRCQSGRQAPRRCSTGSGGIASCQSGLARSCCAGLGLTRYLPTTAGCVQTGVTSGPGCISRESLRKAWGRLRLLLTAPGRLVLGNWACSRRRFGRSWPDSVPGLSMCFTSTQRFRKLSNIKWASLSHYLPSGEADGLPAVL